MSSDVSDNEFDAEAHSRLLETVNALQSKKKLSVSRSDVGKASEFNVNALGKVKVSELMGALPQSIEKNRLCKELERTESEAKTLHAPLPKHRREQVERQTTYRKAKGDVNNWQDIVSRNRQAPQLQFPLPSGDVKVVDTKAFVARFQSQTPLEAAVSKLLGQSQNVLKPNQILTEAEKKALKAMSFDEARERRIELQKHRALVSYQLAKYKRQAKIKSRSYHRILRKEKTKQERQELDKLLESDPVAFMEKLNELKKDRIKERMSLKHRVKGRRLKKMALFSKYDDNMRETVQEMIRKNKELTKKHDLPSDEEEEIRAEKEIQTLEQVMHKQLQAPGARKNPWMSPGLRVKKSDYSKPMPLVNKDATKSGYDFESVEFSSGAAMESVEFSSGAARKSERKAKKAEVAEDDKGDSHDEDYGEREGKERKKGKMEDSSSESEDISDDYIDTNANNEQYIDQLFTKLESKKAMIKKIQNTPSALLEVKKNTRKRKKNQKQSVREEDSSQNKNGSQEKDKKETDKKRSKDESEDEEIVDSGAEEQDEGLILTQKRRQKLEDFEGDWGADDKVTYDRQPKQKDPDAGSNKEWTGDVEADDSDKETATINPQKFMTVETSVEKDGMVTLLEDEDLDAEEARRMTIAQAFADDDVVAEFAEEKRAMIKAEQPKDVDLTLPGWGCWGGKGTIQKQQKILTAPKIKRKDKGKDHVIFTTNQNTKITKHMMAEIPQPYHRAIDFEAYIRQPVGRTWNPESAFKKLTRPKIVTEKGKVITPMTKEKTRGIYGVNTSQQTKKGKRKGKKGGQGFRQGQQQGSQGFKQGQSQGNRSFKNGQQQHGNRRKRKFDGTESVIKI